MQGRAVANHVRSRALYPYLVSSHPPILTAFSFVLSPPPSPTSHPAFAFSRTAAAPDSRFSKNPGKPPLLSEIDLFVDDRTAFFVPSITTQNYGPRARNDALVMEMLERIVSRSPWPRNRRSPGDNARSCACLLHPVPPS